MTLLLDILKVLPQYFALIYNIMHNKVVMFLEIGSLRKSAEFLLHLYAVM
jgi:hypothetical protein